MLYTKSLLDTYIDIPLSPEELGDMLTLKVCEVEDIHIRQIPDDVVIGLVTETRDHPDADKLTVCQVDCGSKGSYQICCGATNVRAGLYVAVALPGCYLPKIDLTIEARDLRGEESNGMICSKQELGIDEDEEHKWIWALQKTDDTASQAKGEIETVRDFADISKTNLGVGLAEKWPWLNTWVMDVENKTITHRPDMFGHFGLAVETHTMMPKAKATDVFTQICKAGKNPTSQTTTDHGITVEVTSPKVLTYGTHLLQDVTREESDLRTRLVMKDLGLAPRSTWVDYSNLFMNKAGQPIHFFDADKIEGGLIIRQAKKGERFVDLFDKEHELTPDDIVIADTKKICALAGIVGSTTSGIDENTKNILVEIANFDPIQVRKTGTRLGLRTDAELRFEKTINPVWSMLCMETFLQDLEKTGLSYTHAGSALRKHESVDMSLASIDVSREGITTMIGSVDQKQGSAILSGLGCTVDGDKVIIPAWRSPDDLETQACLVEEIARITGFENIEPTVHKDGSSYIPYENEVLQRRSLETLMIDRLGFDQVETYPWIHEKWMKTFDIPTGDLYEMANGLNPDWKFLRPTMLPGLLEVIQKNAPFFENIRIFDCGKVRHTGFDTREQDRIAFALAGSKSGAGDALFLQAKGIIAHILETAQAKGKLSYTATETSHFHPLQQASLSLNEKELGSLMSLHPYLLDQLKIPSGVEVIFAQLNLTQLGEIAVSQKKGSRGMSTYETLQDQIISRDLNFVIDTQQGYGTVSDAVLKIKEVKDAQVFDLYAGEHLPEGKKSIALRLKIVGDEELKTEEINAVMDKAIQNAENVGAHLR